MKKHIRNTVFAGFAVVAMLGNCAVTVPSTYDESTGEWIGDVVALTNALKTIGTWNTLYLEKGVYDVSFMTNAPMSVSTYQGNSLLHLNVGVSLIGKTGNRDDVIIKGSGKYRLLAHANGATIKNITFTGGHAEGGKYSIGGAIYPTGSAIDITNCAFLFNSSALHGGAVGGHATNRTGDRFHNCYFYGNSTLGSGYGGAGAGGQFYNCVIVSNRCNYAYGYGGGLSGATVVSGCTIISNVCAYAGGGLENCSGVTGCTIAYNAAYGPHNARGGGAHRCGTITNCIIKGNAASGFGAGLTDTSAVECTFLPEIGAHCSSDVSPTNRYYRCDFSGSAVSGAEIIDSCRIHHVSNVNDVADNVVYGSRQYNVTYPISDCRYLRNTQIDNCWITNTSNHALFYTGGKTSLLAENCTIVDNTLTYTLRGYSNGRECTATFVNTALCNNRRYSIPTDLSGYESPRTSLTNCMLGVSVLTQHEDFANVNTRIMGEDWKPRFVGEGEVPYEPKYSSPLRGWGLLLDWMTEDATDLAGNPRVREGKVDIGCYQCWLEPKYTSVLVR